MIKSLKHSLKKLNRYYPLISKEWVRIFYGGFQKMDGRTTSMSPDKTKAILSQLFENLPSWSQTL